MGTMGKAWPQHIKALPTEFCLKQDNSRDFSFSVCSGYSLQMGSKMRVPPYHPLSSVHFSLLSLQIRLYKGQIVIEENGLFKFKCKESLLS